MKKIRFRHVYMTLFSILILMALFLSDPDVGLIQDLGFGAGFVATILMMLKAILYVAILHISRRALIDYIDLEVYFKRAVEHPNGAGMALIAVALMMIAVATLIVAAVQM